MSRTPSILLRIRFVALAHPSHVMPTLNTVVSLWYTTHHTKREREKRRTHAAAVGGCGQILNFGDGRDREGKEPRESYLFDALALSSPIEDKRRPCWLKDDTNRDVRPTRYNTHRVTASVMRRRENKPAKYFNMLWRGRGGAVGTLHASQQNNNAGNLAPYTHHGFGADKKATSG